MSKRGFFAVMTVFVVLACLGACGGTDLGLATPVPGPTMADPITLAAPSVGAPTEAPPSPTEMSPATETPPATQTLALTETPPATETPAPTQTPAPTETPPATETPAPTQTPAPTETPPATQTRAPTQTPAPTLPPPTPVPPLTPRVLSFTVDPTTTQNLGETLHLAWEAEGETAELCAIWGPGPTDCIQVPLSGETTRVVDQGALAYTGYGLHASAGGSSAWSIVDVHLQCQDLRQWFFSNPPQRCPENEAFHSYAAGQDFERGTMVWVEDEDMFYVFEDVPDGNGYRQVHVLPPLTVPGASPDNRVGENPPPGLYEPVSGFGLLWRGEIEGLAGIDLRQRLGWATEPEFGYDTAQQCSMRSHPRAWSCYMRGPHGEILRLWPDSTAGARTLWEEHASP